MSKIDTTLDGGFFESPIAVPQPRPATDTRISYAQRIIDNPGLYSEAHNAGVSNRNPEGIGFLALVAEDFRTQEEGLFSQGAWALFWHRFGNWRMSVRPKPLRLPLSVLYKVGRKLTQWFAGIDLPYTVNVGRRVRIEHFGGMILVARAIGDDVVIRQNTTFGIARTDRPRDWPIIGDGADIGTGAVILGRVTIGPGARIGANAVVLRDVPAGATAVGVPAWIARAR